MPYENSQPDLPDERRAEDTGGESADGAEAPRARTHVRMALLCFGLAAAGGILFRGVQAGWLLPGPLRLGDVRHAHSHLMLFGWVTPVLMALITVRFSPDATPPEPDARTWGWRLVRLALAFGMLSFPCFLLWGYRPASIGPAEMPLGVITSTFNMFVWYGFGFLWWTRREDIANDATRQLWDLAVAVVVISTVGGWGRGALVGLGIEDPFWTSAAVHSFVDPFTDGWLGAATLGGFYLAVGTDGDTRSRWATRLMGAGLVASFLLGIPVDRVPPPVRAVGSVAGALLAGGFLLHVALLWNHTEDWRLRVPLGALAIKAVALAAAGIPAVARWAEANGLRIPYLHVYLLGFVTLGLVELARRRWFQAEQRPASWPVHAGVAVLLASLWPATGLWPTAWAPGARMTLVAAGTFPLAAAAGWLWARFR